MVEMRDRGGSVGTTRLASVKGEELNLRERDALTTASNAARRMRVESASSA
jgi:hypothetical protein